MAGSTAQRISLTTMIEGGGVLRPTSIQLSAEWGRRAGFYTRTPLVPVGGFNRG
jgi:hypothetical protein